MARTLRKRIVAMILSFCILVSGTVLPVGADGESVAEVISEGFYSFSESIDISRFEIYPEELGAIISSVIKDDPYLFFVSGRMSFSYTPGGVVLSLKPLYRISSDEVQEAIDFCRQEVRKIADAAGDFESDVERALFVHDYICENFEYDDSLSCDDLYDFLKNGRGSCQSYAAAFMAVMRECGIESHFVASDTISHIWNYVRLGGEWYHVDLTWDDSGAGFSRRHFLLSDGLAEERGHRDWYSSIDVDCISETYADADFDVLFKNVHKSGDGDHDGAVGLSDLLLLRRYLTIGDESDVCLKCADINSDGSLDLLDACEFRKKLLATD